MKNIRWGVLSTARIGAQQVIPAIQAANNARLVAVASRSEQSATEFAKRHDIPKAYGSYEQLLRDDDIDAVYIPLPNHLHAKWTIKAAERGKHILCEKPAALTAHQLQEMLDVCERHHVLFAEAFMYQYHDLWKRAHQLIAAGEIGELRMIRAAFSFPLRNPADIRIDPAMGGGSLYDVGCYCVHAIRTLSGGSELVQVTADAKFADDGIVDKSFVGTMRFANGLLAHFDSSFEVVNRQEIEIVGTRGVIRVPYAFRPDQGDPNPKLHIRTEESRVEEVSATPMYQRQIEHFGESVMSGSADMLMNRMEHSICNMQMIDQLYAAAGRKPLVD